MKFILIADEEGVPIAFFPLWEVFCFVLIVIAVLVALFPRHLLDKVLASSKPSAVAIGYLQAFDKRYPQNSQIMLALIEQEAQLGDIGQAQDIITSIRKMKIAPAPDVSAQLRWTDYLILRYKMYEARENRAKHAELLRQLRATASALAGESLSAEQLKILAMDNLAYNQAAVALAIYERLLAANKLTSPAELAEGGTIAMMNNDHRASEEFYLAAYHKAATVNDKRIYARDVIKVLWAGDYLQEAWSFAMSLPEPVLNDPDMLLYMARLAIAANHPDIAQKYALRALLFEHNGKHE